ncbi:MAG: biotin--[acetyl-CoA-carboxylase] ligase [Gammaproteobacteria bacterium TMED225]|nr:MAG: biotin--[acetyl-CoA-carboxylase] ligase [Gammaproteobacteria bacterium TMED225]|tara:strand:- start:8307 stop:9050 length:744 start_codon:yes stop_codon:yes gene_type:complete
MIKLNKDKILKNLPLDKLKLDIYKEIDSTNEEAKRIKITHDFHVIISEKQTKGKGRLGKKWSSPNSGNIYMTICTENDLSISPISLVTALICKKAINKIAKQELIMLKWPNDILLNNKKVGGILVETEIYEEKTRTIIGIGINMSIKKEESWWGDLSKFNIETKRNELINKILSDFIKISDNLNFNWIDEWRDSCIHMNKEIKIQDSDSLEKKAIFKDIDTRGNAIIETKEGQKVITSGEISIKGVY